MAKIVHSLGGTRICDTESRGHETPGGRSPLELVLDSSNGFIPLWAPHTTLRWRFRQRSLSHLQHPDVVRNALRNLLAEAILAWGQSCPVRFTEDDDLWDFELVTKPSDDCSPSGCVLASAFFPDPGRHQLVVYPKMFEQSRKEQIDTLVHELGHIFGLRHFFASVSESAWPSVVFGSHYKFSIMNYGALSELTAADLSDLQSLYRSVWNGSLTHINGTPIRLVRPFSSLSAGRLSSVSADYAELELAGGGSAQLWPASATGEVATSNTLAVMAPMVSVTVSGKVGSAAAMDVRLNGTNLVFQNGLAHAVVKAGQVNLLEWAVVGAPGTTFAMSVITPPSAGCSSTGSLDSNRRAGGICQFQS